MLTLFVWNYVPNATSHYHSGGGVLVIADTLKKAQQMAAEAGAEVSEKEPDLRLKVETTKTVVQIFADAGCC